MIIDRLVLFFLLCLFLLPLLGRGIFKKIIKIFSSRVLRRRILELRGEIAIMILHKSNYIVPWRIKKLRDIKATRNKKLHVGCGGNYKKGWINVDLNSRADLRIDLREKLPFSNNSVETIYSEHFLEHLEYPVDTYFFLGECYRVLKEGGKFVCGVPDHLRVIKSFLSQKKQVLKEMKMRGYFGDCKYAMDFINWSFRQGGEHKYTYDFTTLRSVLKKVGFSNVKKRPWKQGFDSQEWQHPFTLYVEAEKVPKTKKFLL